MDCNNRKAKKANIGDKSNMPPTGGNNPRNTLRNGSVILAMNRTAGLYGSTGNHVSNMRANSSHEYTSNKLLISLISAILKTKSPYVASPNRPDRDAAASTACMQAARKPLSSKTFTPAMVVPAGDVTISLSSPG